MLDQQAPLLSTQEMLQNRQREKTAEIEAKYKDVSVWEMSKRMDAAYHIFNDFDGDFEPDPSFDLESKVADIKKLSPYVQEAVYEQHPKSLAEFEHTVKLATELENTTKEYAELGVAGFSAHALSFIRDPAGLALGVGTGFIGVGAKVARGGRAASLAVDALAAESITATARANMNPIYGVDDAVLDVALAPVTTVLPVLGGNVLSNTVRKSRSMLNESNETIKNAVLQEAGVVPKQEPEVNLAATGTDSPYESAMVGVRLDRFARHFRNPVKAISDFARKAFDDPVGSWGDKTGQGGTAEGIASMHREFIIPRFHKQFNTAYKNLMTETGLDGVKAITSPKLRRQKLNESVRNIYLAIERGDISTLTPAERELKEAMNDAIGQGHRTARDAGVEMAQRFEHDPNYLPITYSKGKIQEFLKKDVVSLFSSAFMSGAAKSGVEMTKNQAKLLGTVMYNKINGALTMDAVSDILEDPAALFRALDEHALEEGVPKDIIKKLLDQYKGTSEKHFKKRANLDRSVEIKTSDGRMLRMVDLIESDPLAIVHGYTNRMTGHAGLAKAAGIVNDESWHKLRKEAAETGGKEALDTLDEMRSVIFGYPVDNSSKEMRQTVTTINSAMSAVSLGNAGIASFPDVMMNTFRMGLASAIKTMPWRLNSMKNVEVEALMDVAALHQIGIEAPYLNSMFANMAEEGTTGVGSYVDSVVRKAANVTMRASLLSGMTEWAQKQAFFGAVVQSFKHVKEGKDIPFALAETGWTKEEADRMKELLGSSVAKRIKSNEVERELTIPDLLQWSFADREVFLRGIYRYSVRASSKMTRGEVIPEFEKPIMRLLLQFRGIVFGSITKRALSGMARIGTGLGMKVAAVGFMAQATALTMVNYLKTESKMLGMDNDSRNKYVKKLGFENLRHYNQFFSGDMDAIAKADGKIIRSIMGYSPSIGGLFELADITASLFGQQQLGGTRYKPVESTLVSSPALSFTENFGRLMFSGWDGNFTAEEANRMKSLMWMNSHPAVQFLSNSIIEEADLKDK